MIKLKYLLAALVVLSSFSLVACGDDDDNATGGLAGQTSGGQGGSTVTGGSGGAHGGNAGASHGGAAGSS
jgi:hypothetical protein